jgi:hypothetical protein
MSALALSGNLAERVQGPLVVADIADLVLLLDEPSLQSALLISRAPDMMTTGCK